MGMTEDWRRRRRLGVAKAFLSPVAALQVALYSISLSLCGFRNEKNSLRNLPNLSRIILGPKDLAPSFLMESKG